MILATGWTPIDPLLSLLTAVLILRSTWRLLAKTTGVLMEGVPSHLDYQEIGTALSQVAGVTSVHDLHVWHMSARHAALSAHVAIDDGAQWLRILTDARSHADGALSHRSRDAAAVMAGGAGLWRSARHIRLRRPTARRSGDTPRRAAPL